MTKFSNKLKKPCFWPIFPIFGAKKKFPGKPSSATHNFTLDSSTMAKFRKTEWHNYKNKPGQMGGWKHGRTDRPYFIGHFRLPPRVLQLKIYKVLLGKGNLFLCCTGPTNANTRQIKIIIIMILHMNSFFSNTIFLWYCRSKIFFNHLY